MCGIVGYNGKGKDTLRILIDGLKALEYRGYDSAGVAYKNNEINIVKSVGKINELEQKIVQNKKQEENNIKTDEIQKEEKIQEEPIIKKVQDSQEIQQIKQEEKLEEEKKQEEFKNLRFYEELELKNIERETEKTINKSDNEMKKDEFEDKDYDGMIEQIDKMLYDIEMTYIKYEGRLTEKQLSKLRKEENELRKSKEFIQNQKTNDYEVEHRALEQPIFQSELDGLQAHLKELHKENETEVSEHFLTRMEKFEGLTREQVAIVDKRILMNRFRKASIALEISSLLALPFIRNKFFLQFTAGLIVDNHFNFINGVFNRKLKEQDPVDLDSIKKGQDALNGALDITYKNIIELDYLEQRALAKYPELSYDPKFISQTTNLRNKLNKKYNKLMKKNELMEKHYGKTKKQTKILKFKKRKENEEAA